MSLVSSYASSIGSPRVFANKRGNITRGSSWAYFHGGVLAEYLLPPNMQSSATSAIYSHHNLPTDRSIIASVHSHPTGNARPSAADLNTFSGGTQSFHVIIGYPYNFAFMQAYDRRGKPIPIEIVASTPFELPGEDDDALDQLLE
jgi:proteasome lid subunit RPN8/RPN11